MLLRGIGYYNMHCHNCNLTFRGFAVPGTVGYNGDVCGQFRMRDKKCLTLPAASQRAERESN